MWDFCLYFALRSFINETTRKAECFIFLHESSFIDPAVSGITITQAS
jgi:hypothetical protein